MRNRCISILLYCCSLNAFSGQNFPEGRLFYTQDERQRQAQAKKASPETPLSREHPYGEVRQGKMVRARWQGEAWIYPNLPATGDWKIQPVVR